MKRYWPFSPIPELVPLSERKRKEVFFACYKKALLRWQFWLIALLDGLLAVFLFFISLQISGWLHISTGQNPWIGYISLLPAIAVMCAAQLFLFLPIIYEQMRPDMRDYIKTITLD